MARVRRIINDVHAVQTQHVVVERELCTVIVEPEGAHLLPRIAVAAESIQAGIAVRVEIVFPEAGSEEVARETVALRTMVPVVQVDRDLIPAKGRSGQRQVISKADEP